MTTSKALFASFFMILCLLFLCTTPLCAQQHTTLSKGWDDLSHPLSSGEAVYQILGGNTLSVTFDLKGAKPNHTYTAGVHLFDPSGNRGDLKVRGFLGHSLGDNAGRITRDGITAYCLGFDFGKLTTDSHGNGSATFKGDIPDGDYAAQFTIRRGECSPSRGVTDGCAAVFRSGTKYAQKTEKITIGGNGGDSQPETGVAQIGPGLYQYTASSTSNGSVEIEMPGHRFCALSYIMSGGFNSSCNVQKRGNGWVLIASDPNPDFWPGETQSCRAVCMDN